MAEPTRIFFAGVTDGNGNAKIPVSSPNTLFAVMTMVGQCPGNPNWIVSVGPQILAFGNGPQVNLGPILTNPGEQLTIAINGGNVNSQVTGTFMGTQHYSVNDAAQNYQPTPNAITVNQFSNLLLTDRIDTAAGTGSKGYKMPAGAQTIMLNVDQANASRNVGPTQLVVRCFPSDFIAIQIGTPAINLNTQQLGLLNPIDTSFDVEWTMVGANANNTFVDVAVLGTNPQKPQNIPFQFDSINNLNVSEASASPATWQAPTNYASLAETTQNTFVLIGAVAGQTIRVFGYTIQLDGGAGLQLASLSDGADSNTSRIVMASVNISGTVTGNMGGVPITTGNPLKLTTFQANNARVTVAYSQG